MTLEEQTFYRAIGSRIKTARLNVPGGKMSQSELAIATGLPRTSISNIENGRHGLPLYSFVSICLVLGIEASDLLPTLNSLKPSANPSHAFRHTSELLPKDRTAIEAILGASAVVGEETEQE